MLTKSCICHNRVFSSTKLQADGIVVISRNASAKCVEPRVFLSEVYVANLFKSFDNIVAASYICNIENSSLEVG